MHVIYKKKLMIRILGLIWNEVLEIRYATENNGYTLLVEWHNICLSKGLLQTN